MTAGPASAEPAGVVEPALGVVAAAAGVVAAAAGVLVSVLVSLPQAPRINTLGAATPTMVERVVGTSFSYGFCTTRVPCMVVWISQWNA